MHHRGVRSLFSAMAIFCQEIFLSMIRERPLLLWTGSSLGIFPCTGSIAGQVASLKIGKNFFFYGFFLTKESGAILR